MKDLKTSVEEELKPVFNTLTESITNFVSAAMQAFPENVDDDLAKEIINNVVTERCNMYKNVVDNMYTLLDKEELTKSFQEEYNKIMGGDDE